MDSVVCLARVKITNLASSDSQHLPDEAVFKAKTLTMGYSESHCTDYTPLILGYTFSVGGCVCKVEAQLAGVQSPDPLVQTGVHIYRPMVKIRVGLGLGPTQPPILTST